jgi:hypothetical protein
MRRWAAAAVLGALALAGSGAAAPNADTLIRPGRSIGKAQLGMTEAQLRRAAGRPLAVVRRNTGFGRATAEYQYADFELFVQLRGRRGALRVVRVLTFQTSERTAEGVGVGSPRSRLLARYRGRLRCPAPRTYRNRGRVYVTGQTCALPAGGARTVFQLDAEVEDDSYWGERNATLAEWPRLARVAEVTIETLS